MAENKVTFGLSGLHIAFQTGTDDAPAWGAPIEWPGAISMSQAPAGASNILYADNIPYYVSESNNGYTSTLTVATIPRKIEEMIWGLKRDASGLVIEFADVEPPEFALLAQTEGDTTPIRLVYYRCKASRATEDFETKGENIVPKTKGINITVTPLLIPIGSDRRPINKAKIFKTDATGTAWEDFISDVVLPTSLVP